MTLPAAYETCLQSKNCSICSYNSDFHHEYNHACTTKNIDTLFGETSLVKYNRTWLHSRDYYIQSWSTDVLVGCNTSIENVNNLVCVDIYSSSGSYISDGSNTYSFDGSLNSFDYHSSLSHSSSFGCIIGDRDITYTNVSGYDHIYNCFEDYYGYRCPDCHPGEKCAYIGYKSNEYVTCHGHCECLMGDVLCPQFKQV